MHDRFRGVNGSFKRTLEAAQAVRDLGMELQINTTVSRFNAHDLIQIAALVERLDAVLWSAFFLIPVGRAKPTKFWMQMRLRKRFGCCTAFRGCRGSL